MNSEYTEYRTKSTTAAKGLHKLESIGKKGKLSKIIKLTLEHFEFLR
jgi:hypothetical protein